MYPPEELGSSFCFLSPGLWFTSMSATCHSQCWGTPSKSFNSTHIIIACFICIELSLYEILLFLPDTKLWFQSDLLHGRKIFSFHINNIFRSWIHTQQAWQNMVVHIHIFFPTWGIRVRSLGRDIRGTATLISLGSSASCWCRFRKLWHSPYLTNLRSCQWPYSCKTLLDE